MSVTTGPSRPTTLADLPLRDDLRGQTPYGAPQLHVPVAINTNENSYAVPPTVVAAMAAEVGAELAALNRYPDREFTALREALAGYLGHDLTAANIWAGNGSNEVLQHLVQAFAGPGRTALGFTPSYSMHPIISRGLATAWIDGVRRPSDDPELPFGVDAGPAAAQVAELRPDVVFLCSPNNPTGTAMGLDVVEAVYAASTGLVVVDEAYTEFSRPGTPSALTLLPGRPRLVVSRTMSKAFALAGARLGYLAADPAVCDALRLVRLPYHLSSPTQAVARAALAHVGELLATVDAIKVQRDRIVAELPALGARPVPSDANFVMFAVPADEKVVWQGLLERGVLVRDVGVPGHLRVTAGTPDETTSFLSALADVLESLR